MKKILLILVCLCGVIDLWAQTKTVTGQVVDASGDPVIGASVLQVGTTNGTITDVDGYFSLSAPLGANLQVSYLGYQTQTFTVGAADNYPLTLKEDAEMLDEVVVTGYGMSQKRSLMTNAISKLDDQVLKNAAMGNAAQSLQGTVSGLRVTTTSGKPGSAPNVVLRGGASISRGLDGPLVVVDGVVCSLDDVNPSDIASIEVLKDAASTAIYGARANNGVILVTTRKGAEGRTLLTYQCKLGLNFKRDGYHYLDAGDYLHYQRLGWQRTNGATFMENQKGFGVESGVDLAFLNAENRSLLQQGWLSMPDPVEPSRTLLYRNHAGELHDLTFRNAAFLQDHYLNLTGGNAQGTFSASLGYYTEQGQVDFTEFRRVSGTLNGSYRLLPCLKVQAGSCFSWSKAPDLWTYDLNHPWNGETGEFELFYRTMSMFPTWNPWNEDGTPASGWSNQDGNPRYWKERLIRSSTSRKTSFNLGLTFDLLPEMLFLNEASSMYYTEGQADLFEKRYQRYGQTPNTNRNASETQEKSFQQQHALTLEFRHAWEGHSLNVMLGGEYFDQQYRNLVARVSGAPTDDVSTLNAGTNRTYTSSFRTGYRILSGFARVNYDFRHRYLLSLVARRDGISRLSDHRWGFFPGASVGWSLHEEPFFQHSFLAKYVSLVKPRLSYGLNGNVNGIGNFDVYGRYGSVGSYHDHLGYLNTGVVNRTLRWEKSRTLEVGLDLGFLANRIHLVMDYYDRTTSDLLTDVNLPAYTGFPSFKTNLGSLSNRGFEIEGKVNVLHRKDWNWDLALNASYVKNRVKKLPYNGNERNRQGGEQVWDPKSQSLVWVGGLQEGKGLGDVVAYVQHHIFRDWDDVRAHAARRIDEVANLYGPELAAEYAGRKGWRPIEPGDVCWDDLNGDGVINSYDRRVVGNLYPRWTGGFSTTLSYKRWTLYGRFDYATGHTLYNDLKARILGQYNGSFNLITQVRDTWSETNPDTDLPKFYWADQNAKKNYTRSNNGTTKVDNNNSHFYQKGDYLCLREITLSYQFPAAWLKSVFLTDASVYVTGQNLCYFTGYDGTSPEPALDVLGNGRGGIDNGRYPMPRTLLFGLKLSF